ncbi:MAG: 4Fe-4S dicluster domain-containing protein [Asgard group archaeon]|nr:4Fe-4S dicluster domain-containing protein [Asgard group archaeon]
MRYRTLGKTGIKVSILGYGILRLPEKRRGRIDIDESIRMIRRSIDNGLNFVDTAYNYHNGKSEVILGQALKDSYREKVTLMTKCPTWEIKTEEDFNRILDEQLARLEVDYIDIYLFHNINEKRYKEIILKFNLFDKMLEAKKKGKIKHIGFSSHEKPKNIKKYIDENDFEVVLVQYNFVDPINEEIIQYAHDKGLGVILMGPCGGGRLTNEPTEEMKQWLTPGKTNFSDLAFKFVWSNPHVTIALSGMSSEKIVDENMALASSKNYQLNAKERERLGKVAQKFQETYDLDCTQCGYCDNCPEDVNIKLIFKELMRSRNPLNMHKARANYRGIGLAKRFPGKNALACVECGECLEKCPQEIPIIDRLKEAHSILKERDV